jgi:FeS assembly SUF system regulator
MIKISKLADYAVVLLAELSKGDMLPATTLAQQTRLPEPTVSKVMKILNKSNITESVRGAHGGYKLTRAQDEITIAEIITAIDGPIALTACADESHDECSFSAGCSVSGRWTNVNNAVKDALARVTLADMTQNNNYMAPEGMQNVANR